MSEEIKLVIEGYYFSWDDRKEQINSAKHHISFKEAAQVFFDENACIEPDTTTNEERYHIIGRQWDKLFPILFVVYVERYTEDYKLVFRLISARKAERKEVRKYDGQGAS